MSERIVEGEHMRCFARISTGMMSGRASDDKAEVARSLKGFMTFPVTTGQIIAGKFAAACGFLAMLVAPTLIFVVALELYGRPDYGELLCGYLGVLLAGGMYLASGIFASTLTANQVVAYLITVFYWLILMIGAKGLPHTDVLPARLQAGAVGVLFALDPELRLGDFVIGLIDSANIVYFCSVTLVFLTAAALVLDFRRWR